MIFGAGARLCRPLFCTLRIALGGIHQPLSSCNLQRPIGTCAASFEKMAYVFLLSIWAERCRLAVSFLHSYATNAGGGFWRSCATNAGGGWRRARIAQAPSLGGGASTKLNGWSLRARSFFVGLTLANKFAAFVQQKMTPSEPFNLVGGERGIRTPGNCRFNSFQDCRNRPLCQLSACKIMPAAKNGQINNYKSFT